MSRRKLSKKRIFKKDPFYNNELIQIIINRIMKKGNKALARKIIYRSLKDIELVTKQDPIKIVEQAVNSAAYACETPRKELDLVHSTGQRNSTLRALPP